MRIHLNVQVSGRELSCVEQSNSETISSQLNYFYDLYSPVGNK